MPKIPTPEFQAKAISTSKAYFEYFQQLLNWYRATWIQLFRATYIFETDRNKPGQSQVFWPICYREAQKVADRLTTNNPKFVVNLNVPINPDRPEADMSAYQKVNQKALNYFWKIGNSQAKLRSWAKQGVDYGVSFAMVDFDRKIHKSVKKEVGLNDEGIEVERTTKTEELLMEYPCFKVPDLLDVYFDPRIELVDDMQAIILNKDNVRKTDLIANKDIYFNLDQLNDLQGAGFSMTGDNYKLNKFNQEGIAVQDTDPYNQTVNIKEYYGYFSEDDSDDQSLWHFTIVNDNLLIRAEEINFLPFEKFVPIEIPAQGVGKGIVEPIKKLQDAYNLVRNQRLENVSLVINRMWLMKQGGGVDQRKLVSKAGNVITVKDMDALRPIDTPDLSASSFNETQALNTEIQSVNSTIDATQDSSSSGFTNLATGQRIRWNEFNTRFKTIKNNLEEALGRLGMKMLMLTAERAQQNPLIYDEVTKEFYEVAKDAFDSISDFYTVNIVANSTAFDNVENQRDEALAKWQLAITAKAQGLPIDLKAIFEEIMQTFPGTDMKTLFQAEAPQVPGAPSSLPQSIVKDAQIPQTEDAALNQSLTTV